MAMGRPKIEIDKEQFEKLCGLQCTRQEIAEWFNCSHDTIERWCKREYGSTFALISEKKRAAGKVSLRRMQFQLAEKSATMAIWLGKQYLGQTDSPINSNDDEMAIDALSKSLDDLAKVMTDDQ